MKKFTKRFFLSLYKKKKTLIKFKKFSFSEKEELSKILKIEKKFENENNIFEEEEKNYLEYLKNENWELKKYPKNKKIILKKEFPEYKINLIFFSKSKQDQNFFAKNFLLLEKKSKKSKTIFIEFYLKHKSVHISNLFFVKKNSDFFLEQNDLNFFQTFDYYKGPKFFKLSQKFKEPIYNFFYNIGLNQSIIFIMNFQQRFHCVELRKKWYQDFDKFFK